MNRACAASYAMGPSTVCAAGTLAASVARAGADDPPTMAEVVAESAVATSSTAVLFSDPGAPREGSARMRRIAPQGARSHVAKRAFFIGTREFPWEWSERQKSAPAMAGRSDAKQATRHGGKSRGGPMNEGQRADGS